MGAMFCDREKSASAFWITVALAAVLVGYPLSFGRAGEARPTETRDRTTSRA